MGALDSKVVLVTGAGGGIGRAIAMLAAREGAKVVVNDIGASLSGSGRSDGPAEETVRAIRENGGEAAADTNSVTDPDGAAAMVAKAVSTFGRIDGVVNNAGILRDVLFHKMTHEDWRTVIDVHLHGSFNVARAAAAYFRQQESGAFVHFTSTSGLVGSVGQANYAAAKMGVVGLSTGIAHDMARFNVRSNCVAPFAWSRMLESIPTDDPAVRARMERLRTMSPEKIAPLVVFLLGNEAAEVNGQVFAVRQNEIFLMSQPRAIRSMHRGDGWTPATIAGQLLPAFRRSLIPLERTQDAFAWEPV